MSRIAHLFLMQREGGTEPRACVCQTGSPSAELHPATHFLTWPLDFTVFFPNIILLIISDNVPWLHLFPILLTLVSQPKKKRKEKTKHPLNLICVAHILIGAWSNSQRPAL